MQNDKFFPGTWKKYGEAWHAAVGYWSNITKNLTQAMVGIMAVILLLVKIEISYVTLGIAIVAFAFIAKWIAKAASEWHVYKDVECDTSIVVRPQWGKMGGSEKEWRDRKKYD